ncbi:MAG TPA: L-threonylcarbamoyladenylate synthase [Thiobacillaceae bacterium]|nr:L-threonylcarbamoyladenylate synthase [Thiobacillaceae bacterium]
MTPRPHIPRLRAWLQAGGVIAYPTESCYGLGCDPRNARAVKRILRFKGRPRGKGLILIAARFEQLAPFLAPVPPNLQARFPEWWPGPTTLLLPAAEHCPPWLTGRHDKLAVRVTAHPEAARLCRALGMALVSTSANRSGQRPLKTAAACRHAFGARVRTLDGRIGRRKRPSTILDPGSARILRP